MRKVGAAQRGGVSLRASVLIAASGFLLAACGQGDSDVRYTPDKDATLSASAETVLDADSQAMTEAPSQNWLSYGGSYDEQRYSLLTQINKGNLDQLGAAWVYEQRKTRGVETTPIVKDGVMYATGSWSIVYALDAKTGEELWVYDPQVSGADAAKGCCDVVNRGVALADGRVFIGVFDGRLEALDATTGEVLWSTVTVDQSKPYTITGAPRVANGLVYIGNGGAEYGVRGYVSAYDAATGDLVWRFYTTPNPEKNPDGAASDDILAKLANDSWGDDGEWVMSGGGGTVWDSIIYDEVHDNLVFGVGNGSPWNAHFRDPNSDGDNIFLASIVAVDAKTGAYKWHYQTTPREQWDYTATQPLAFADLPLGEDGAMRRVVMQAPKNGFFYVLDAETGKFIHADKLIPLNWATGFDENGRPIVNPAARNTSEGFLLLPGSTGAHNWNPMAFSPQTNYAYMPIRVFPQFYKDRADDAIEFSSSQRVGYDTTAAIARDFPPAALEAFQSSLEFSLTAWDTVNNRIAWKALQPTADSSGVLATASGLVFQGGGEGVFYAYDAANGDVLWQTNIQQGMIGGVTSYEVDGEQYIAFATGMGGVQPLVYGFTFPDGPVQPGLGRIVAMKLGGTAEIPPLAGTIIEEFPKADLFGDEETLNLGFDLFANMCAGCHGAVAIGGGIVPDLRWSYIAADQEAFRQVVYEGLLVDNGMPPFADYISESDVEAIRAYVIEQGHLAVRNRAALNIGGGE